MTASSSGSPKAPSHSARSRTLETLRRKIVTLELAPGTSLSENELAQSLDTSRTPVRESLILLQQEALVQVFPQIGTFVSLVDIERVTQAQFIREAIECASLNDAVARVTEEDLTSLRSILAQQEVTEIEGDVEKFFALDERFHRKLLSVGGHESAWAAVTSAKAHLDRARRLSLIDTRPISTLVGQHTDIVDALASRDAATAIGALRVHLRAVFEDIERIRAAVPHLFSDGRTVRLNRRTVHTLD
ncbi:transcriptional regulator [Arthrobacter sp. RIT-PI-e]|uniref:GntR family transcriptional regulator n=1 Tax=Arthrobacter sp. RIT-PI-e TaxID=1681197 RepID=UPI000675E9F6|nr:GntR family transcriptional regulator [Arthrobacter sp. RIT-PI-e]KNC20140.1 transcriptional regulator [Arthrobacter sp. RIT-PI-e]